MADSDVQIQPESTGPKIDMCGFTRATLPIERQRVETYGAPADNTFGEASVAPAATVSLVSFAAPVDWAFTGIVGGGEGDGLFEVLYGVTKKYAVRIDGQSRRPDFSLGNPDATAGGQTVDVKVTNNAGATANFEATLLGVLLNNG